MKTKYKDWCTGAAWMMCCLLPSVEVAAESVRLEEIVVTARKRTESIQQVPMSVSAFDSSALEKIGFSNLTDLAENVPSLSMSPYPNNSSAMVVYLRGVGTIDSEQIARDPGVGIYLDDVYLGRAQGLAGDLADIQRIEVLRGPQGTLYGRNTIGGAIKFLTAEPTGEFGFRQTLTTGNYDYRRSVTRLNLPEAGGLSAKITYLNSHEGGWVDNPGSQGDFGERDKEGYRLALRWQPSSELTVDYAHDRSSQDGIGFYQQRGGVGLFGSFTTPISDDRRDTAIRTTGLPLRDDFVIRGHGLTINWDLTDQISLKSVTAYRESDAHSVHDTMEAFGLPAAFSSDTEQEQYSQELLLNGYTEKTDIEYTVGLFYFEEKATQLRSSLANPFALLTRPMDPVNVFRSPTLADLVPSPEAKVKNSASAIYGQMTWNPAWFDSRWSLTVGGRYSRDERELERTLLGVPYDKGDTRDSSFDPSITLQYRFNYDIQVYLSRLQGYRTGGFNLRSAANTEPFKKEELITYEAGLKSSWANRLRFNLSVYQSDYEDMQLDFIEPLTNAVNTINAAEAEIRGAEMELFWLPLSSLSLSLNYAYMDAQLKGDAINPFTGLALQGISLPHTPRHKVNTALEYTFPQFEWGTLSAWLAYSWEDEQTTNGGPNTADDPRPEIGLVDARLTLADIPTGSTAQLSLALWGKNLLDEEQKIFTLYGADIYGQPRSFGVEMNFRY